VAPTYRPGLPGPIVRDRREAIGVDDVLRLIEEHGIQLVRFETPDLNGISRGKTIAADHFGTYYEHGLALVSDIYCWDHECWVATNTGFGEDLTFADLVMRPDLETFRVLPHRDGEARVICDMEYSDGRPVEAGPRSVLRRAVDRAAERGWTVLMQTEYEFYLLDPESLTPPFEGTDITTTLTNQRLPVLKDLILHTRELGLSPNTLNQEWGPTQYELNFDPEEGVRAGDLSFTYKTYAKEIASQHDLLLTFMTKPWSDRSGCSSHLHMSFFEGERNLFHDEADPNGVSDLLRWAVGGQLRHSRALNALFAPTVNCPKRYRKGTYAPASITWGFENRSVAVRVKAWRGQRTHIENRLGSGSSNPYLVMAGLLLASLDGIDQRIEPPEALQTNAYLLDDLDLLPRTLEDSLDEFEKDEVLRDAFHPEFLKAYTGLKRHEIEKARAANTNYGTPSWDQEVTDWERHQFMKLS
jgi:glutamine synthetase